MSVYEDILSSSNIVDILNYYGLAVNKNKCTCPFHNDKHPSMMVNENKGIAKCFVCGSGGNAISFIQKYENEINHNPINLVQAMQKAIDIQHLNIVIPQNNQPRILKEKEKIKQKYNSILKDAITISENNLRLQNTETTKVMNYLKSRNLNEEIIRQFHIGYDFDKNNILDELLNKYNVNDLIELGLAKKYNNWISDVFKNRITIPIFDENGNPVGFGARALGDIKPKYINTSETPAFNKSKILFNYHNTKHYARNFEIIIVEGYMDVISSKAIGFDNVVGIMGTALTNEQLSLIKKLNCEITLCLDNDEAGKNAMIRIITELLKENIEVNILDLSSLNGNYKDFGDLQIANVKKEDIYNTKVSAFIFLLKNKYLQDKKINVDKIYSIYKKMQNDGLIKDTKDISRFKEYISSVSELSKEEVENIIMPKEIKQESRIDRYKGLFFYYYISDLLKKYATNHQDRILQKFLETGILDKEKIEETLNNENYLKDNENTIDIAKYVNEYIYNSEEFIKFKNDKVFILEKLLDNVKSYDSKGNIVNVKLTIEQKEIILKQYNESFGNSIREYIENNPDEFEELFIANNSTQFEKLFPSTYIETLKEQSIQRFKDENVMEAVRYGLAYPENMKSALSEQYVKNDKYKTLLVFNNSKNILKLTKENLIEKSNEKEKGIEYTHKEITKNEETKKERNKDEMSVFIKLSGKEKQSYKGIYLPINSGIQVFIPKQLYKIDDDKLEIINSNSGIANMSEYAIDEENRTKKWISRLTTDEFYHKYFNLYEISMGKEKEVMPSASY